MVVAHAAGFGFGLGFFNFLGTILFFVVLIKLLPWLWHRDGPRRPWGRRGHRRHYEQDAALETARERLARGDITADEFEAIRKVLAEQRQPMGYAAVSEMRWPWERDEALETARLRFARGEMGAEDFEAIKRAL